MSSDRVFLGEDGQWYFNVRGNQASGPFPSRQDAEQQLIRHVNACRRRVEGGALWPQELKPAHWFRRLRHEARTG